MVKQLIYGPLFALGVLKPFAALKTWWVPQGLPSATCGCDVHLLLVSKVAQLRGSLVELGPIEGEKRIFKKQKSAVPPAEACRKL